MTYSKSFLGEYQYEIPGEENSFQLTYVVKTETASDGQDYVSTIVKQIRNVRQ